MTGTFEHNLRGRGVYVGEGRGEIKEDEKRL